MADETIFSASMRPTPTRFNPRPPVMADETLSGAGDWLTVVVSIRVRQ